VTAFVSGGAGFLLAVLWFDLMFDVQAARRRGGAELSEQALASIAAYYRRVTTEARPMSRVIAVVMVATLAAIVVQLAGGEAPTWVSVVSLALAGGAIAVAGAHTVPSAVRLGARRDDTADQSRLARSILRDHLLCAGAIATVLVVQLTAAT
jgi:hypothetical protein